MLNLLFRKAEPLAIRLLIHATPLTPLDRQSAIKIPQTIQGQSDLLAPRRCGLTRDGGPLADAYPRARGHAPMHGPPAPMLPPLSPMLALADAADVAMLGRRR